MIISTIKHPVQTRDSKWHPLIVRNRSFPFEGARHSWCITTSSKTDRDPDTWHTTCTSTVHEEEKREKERERKMKEIGFEDRGGTAVLDIEHTAVCASTSGRDRAPRGRGGAVDSCELLKFEKSVESVGIDTFCTRSGGRNIVDDNILTFASPPAFLPGFIDHSLSPFLSPPFRFLFRRFILDRLPYRCRSISLLRFPPRINAGLNS